jgi:hypothetical protein
VLACSARWSSISPGERCAQMAVAFLLCSPVLRGHDEPRAMCMDTRNCRASRPWISRRIRAARRAEVRASAQPINDDDNDDGGDGFFGGTRADMQASLGISALGLTMDEVDYLTSATSDSDRMDRIRNLARKKKDSEGIRVSNRIGSSADSYIASLSRKLPQGQQGNANGEASEERQVVKQRKPLYQETEDARDHRRRGMNAGDRYLADLTRAKNETGSGKRQDGTNISREEELEETTSSISALERKLKALAARSAEDDDLDSGGQIHPPTADDPTIDKQIKFLEEHLARLKAEDADRGPVTPLGPRPDQAAVRSQVASVGRKMDPGRFYPASSSGQSQGWGDGSVDMSEEEQLAAFDEVRRRNAELRDLKPADPLAIPLPEKRGVTKFGTGDDYEGDDGPGELTEEEIQAKFEHIRQSSLELAASRPAPVKRMEDELRLAVIALRIEHDRYCDDVKSAQEAHEQKVRDIFKRYVPDLN